MSANPASRHALRSHSPIDGAFLGECPITDPGHIDAIMTNAQSAFEDWRLVPAPLRGELTRIWAQVLRERKADLANIVCAEVGKTLSESLGEVQEMIDICDFATGLSRQLHGLTIASERPQHHLVERWQPLGPVVIISAFNFPVAVFAWNAALALICGNSLVWKPSEKAPLCALAVMASLEEAILRLPFAVPKGLCACVQGEVEAGQALTMHPNTRLISATGSTRMGRAVALAAAPFFKRTLLELGGNAAMIVSRAADLDLALRAICFGAVGTAGQRCTSLRRLILHESIADNLWQALQKAYASLAIGDPRLKTTLIGPLIDQAAFEAMQAALVQARSEGGEVWGGERVIIPQCEAGYFVRPALVRMPKQSPIVRQETFAPILYGLTYRDFDEAIALQNDVPQGLSSAIFSHDMRETEAFLSAAGSDCGIANVNAGPSGAEIGGAFGGEKETGGGRESGSDAWKAYMRRQTQTINFGRSLPLAQGVTFDL